ncbi:MAG TPA: hypothetical protein VL652_23215 [Kutzneria sp.]|nr:hypothetical protein [Kutzneria sp.]
MAAKSSAAAMTQAERCLATGNATRVGSIISVFFEAAGNQQDAFPAVQGVEACWRELGGSDEAKLRREVLPAVDTLRRRARSSGLPYGTAVSYALDAAHSLVVEWTSESPRYATVAGDSLAVAVEFDRFGIEAPKSHGSWTLFELSAQAALAGQIFEDPGLLGRNELFSVRVTAGSSAMSYAQALTGWITSRPG